MEEDTSSLPDLWSENTDIYDVALDRCRCLLESLQESVCIVNQLNKRFNTIEELSKFCSYPEEPLASNLASCPDLTSIEDQSPKSRNQIELTNCSQLINCCFIKLRLSMDSVLISMQRLVTISQRQSTVLHLDWQESGSSKTSTMCHH